MIIQLIVILVAALLAVLFTFQNPHHVQMHFMAWQTAQFPIIALILVSALAGVIMTAVLGLKTSWRLSRRIRELEAELNASRQAKAEEVPERPDAGRQTCE
ncbi:MAG: LapA family protein [Elusimicrobia bacterium]|nr:LapA family protein [Elusimicrobiota bacterium]